MKNLRITIAVFLVTLCSCNESSNRSDNVIYEQYDQESWSKSDLEYLTDTGVNHDRLVGLWYDKVTSDQVGKRMGQKIVLGVDGKLYFELCAIADEQTEIGAKSELNFPHEIVYNGSEYVDMIMSDQRLQISKTGDLRILDQLGLIDTYTKIFIDPTIIKF